MILMQRQTLANENAFSTGKRKMLWKTSPLCHNTLCEYWVTDPIAPKFSDCVERVFLNLDGEWDLSGTKPKKRRWTIRGRIPTDISQYRRPSAGSLEHLMLPDRILNAVPVLHFLSTSIHHKHVSKPPNP